MEDCFTRDAVEWTRLIFQVVIILATILGNLLVIVSIIFVKVLREPKNYLILSLAIADLLVGAVVMPMNVVATEISTPLYNSPHCYIWVQVELMACSASIYGLCLISLDRYVAISQPLFYRVNVSTRTAYTATAGSWIASFAFTIPYYVIAESLTEPVEGVKYTACMYIANSLWLKIYLNIMIFIPMALLVLISGKLCSLLSKRKFKFQNSFGRESVDSSCASGTGSPKRFKCKLAGVLKEWKGCFVVGVVVGAFLICWLPYMSIMLIDAIYDYQGEGNLAARWVFQTGVWFMYINSCLNPVIYSMLIPEFRFAFKELICLRGSTLNAKIRAQMYSQQFGKEISLTRICRYSSEHGIIKTVF